MTDPQQDKVLKLHESRGKAESELKKIQQQISDAVDNGDRRVRVERLVTSCNDAMTKAIAKNDQLHSLAAKADNPETLTKELESWLNDVTTFNDEVLKRAREYIDSFPATDDTSQSSAKTARKTVSSKSCKSGTSKTSSQRQKALLLAKHKREELERQIETSLRLAKQKQEIELQELQQEKQRLQLEQEHLNLERLRKVQQLQYEQERLQREQALQLEQLEEENRQKIAEAKLAELELIEDVSEYTEELKDTLSHLSRTSKVSETQRVADWVDNTAGTISQVEVPSAAVDSTTAASQPQPQSSDTVATNTAVSQEVPQLQQAITDASPGNYQSVQPNLIMSPQIPIIGSNYQQPLTVTCPNSTPPTLAVLNHVPISQPLPTSNSGTVPIKTINPNASSLVQHTSIPLSNCSKYPNQNLSTSPNARFAVPANHAVPNLSSWTFPVPSSRLQPEITVTEPIVSHSPVIHTSLANTNVNATNAPVIPVQSGGTVFYCNPQTLTVPSIVTTSLQQPFINPLTVHDPTFTPTVVPVTPQVTPSTVTVQDLTQLLTATKRDHLPEWKLAQYNGDPLQWHEWIGQFRSAIDSTTLSDDVKLTYLKTLVTGKAKTAIAEFAYCGTMYRDALQTLERKFGQPHAVVTAYLDKLTNVPPLKMHNSESIISYSATISGIVGVFRSLKYDQDLSSASLLGQAVQKLPPNMKEAWSMHTVKRNWCRPTLLDFNDWLKDKAEAHERMKTSSSKTKTEENGSPTTTRTKTAARVFASTTTSSKPSSETNASTVSTCVVCKEKHPLWRCPAFKLKTPTQKAKIAADNKLCFSCLNGQHSFRKCPKPRKCTKEGCSSTHNTLLHGAERIFQPKNDQRTTGNRESSGNTSVTVVKRRETHESSGIPSVTDTKGLLQITEVELQSPSSSETILVLCDSACSHSWISEKLATKLNVKGSPTKLTVHGINSQQTVDTHMVELKLTPVHSGGSCSPFVVKPYVRKELNVGTDLINVESLKQKYPHLEPIALQKYSYNDVEMILGQDVFHSIRPLEYFESDRKDTPIAVRLPLGWVLSGPLPSTSGLFSTCFKAVVETESDSKLADQLRSWYEMESFGAKKQVDPRSAADARALKILEHTTYHDGSRYHVGMLWAEEESTLPNNYFSALVQLKSLERRLEKSPDLKNSYAQTIQDDFDKGYIVQVNKSECFKTDNPREWYLPHHPVLHPHKPGKVRRVLNGAAKFHGHSLNNALLTGPDLLQSLIHVLLRFRQYRHAVSADIEGMFLQVGVIPADQPSLRFLWREDPATEVTVYQYARHIFGAKDSPTCANYALKRNAIDHENSFPEAACSVQNNFYMDDYLESSPTVEEATQKAQDLVKLLALGGFSLTKFVSNVPSVLTQLGPNDKPPDNEVKVLATDEESSHVLGLKWNHRQDTLVVSRGTSPDTNRAITQRVVLSLVSAVYDPFGLVAPYTVKARLLLKDIWRLSGQQWDDDLPENIVSKFLEWSNELPSLSEITIPRSYFQANAIRLELHMFGDSSQDVFSAVAFLRGKVTTAREDITELAFVFGKTRVAPMKALTIPKLELQAALLAARLKDEILRALTLNIERTFMWTDSTTVLQWLHSIDKKPVFVANRVAEILELTTVDEWNHVQTADNPADAGTRGLSASALLESNWLKGPDFLRTSDWPFTPSVDILNKIKLKKLDTETIELDPENPETTTHTANIATNASTFEWQKYSSYEKLLRIVAYVLRIVPKFSGNRTNSGSITDPDELVQAEQKLFYLVQTESFPSETKCLLKATPLSKSSPLTDFSPFIGPNGLFRATGRTKLLEVATFDVKHPILLDSRHPLVRLFLEHLHVKHCHQGVEYMRALIQQKFAIVKLRTALRSIQSKCITCRKRKAETLSPMMADLPKERLAFGSPPFINTGLDYFGPFYVSVKRSTEKRWGFVFTCMTTRAVHFEVVPSMDTSSCVMGIERFVSRRGVPSVIWSDNGTNFIATEKELLNNIRNWNQQVLTDSLVKKGIKWKFNPPSAPHHGGVWERLVRSFKHVFYAILGNRRLTDEILTTTFCLVEQSLNARPLVPASADATDLDALTPNHFLLGNVGSSLPGHCNSDFDHRKRYARAQAYSDAIWNRWLKEYVPTLNRRAKWSTQPDQNLKIGDLVWIVESNSPRGYYPLARIVKLNYGNDSIARSAEIRTTSGNLVRPVVKLAPVLPHPESD